MTKDEALKLALEALEEINKLSIGENAICLPAEIDTAMDAIKEALAQPEQEPVAWRAWVSKFPQGTGSDWVYVTKPIMKDRIHNQPLYTTPPQRKPLTDEEIILIVADCASSHQHTDIHFARAIEAAHGIKRLV